MSHFIPLRHMQDRLENINTSKNNFLITKNPNHGLNVHHLRRLHQDALPRQPPRHHIIYVPADTQLTQDQKQLIAREFNLSETVFLHEQTSADIFAPLAEG
ncbi:hypothetical protein F4813DRAFT_395221 [Daldinia decipiens]|uniref:uncharacterized protein n=1 Tax=Daldinia decipiens TaxID=326647 RepID=UPI0020C536C5|nr:uncharacterized protein F4813DRAFT_395221 [Daldinia decipiens]KAI1659351.1 hypothetical protein F4813DRAFT_395221 [Daldinia decipiens]